MSDKPPRKYKSENFNTLKAFFFWAMKNPIDEDQEMHAKATNDLFVLLGIRDHQLAKAEAELAREREKNKQLEAALDVQVGMIACSGCEERDEKAKELVFALKRIAGRGLANTTYMHVAEEPLAKYREEKK